MCSDVSKHQMGWRRIKHIWPCEVHTLSKLKSLTYNFTSNHSNHFFFFKWRIMLNSNTHSSAKNESLQFCFSRKVKNKIEVISWRNKWWIKQPVHLGCHMIRSKALTSKYLHERTTCSLAQPLLGRTTGPDSDLTFVQSRTNHKRSMV